MAEAPFFSVIVPTYNRRKLVQRTVECLLEQDYPPQRFEIIVVDDGSTDDTLVFLESLQDGGKLRYCTQFHQNPGAARNRGAQIARGEILAFTDHDCQPEPGWLSALAGFFTSALPETPAVGGPIFNVTQGHWLHQFQALRSSDHMANFQSEPLYLDTANAAIRRSAFDLLGGFGPAYHWSEDVDLGFRLRRSGFRLVTTPSAVVWHTGATSLGAYLMRSFRIGSGTARLIHGYPEEFLASSPKVPGSPVKLWLNRLVREAGQAPGPGRVVRIEN